MCVCSVAVKRSTANQNQSPYFQAANQNHQSPHCQPGKIKINPPIITLEPHHQACSRLAPNPSASLQQEFEAWRYQEHLCHRAIHDGP